jgi:hypothetical protein
MVIFCFIVEFYDDILGHGALSDLVFCMVTQCCLGKDSARKASACYRTRGPLGEFIEEFNDHPGTNVIKLFFIVIDIL